MAEDPARSDASPLAHTTSDPVSHPQQPDQTGDGVNTIALPDSLSDAGPGRVSSPAASPISKSLDHVVSQPAIPESMVAAAPEDAQLKARQPLDESVKDSITQSPSLHNSTLEGLGGTDQKELKLSRIDTSFPAPVDVAKDDGPGQMDDDGGVIRCICGLNDDDGFTIQCDRCLVWQHCACFGMSSDSVPDEYLCELCDPRPVDVAFAKAVQQNRRDEELRKAKSNDRGEPQADLDHPRHSPIVSKPASEEVPISQPVEVQGSTPQHHRTASISSKVRKLTQNIDLSNTGFVMSEHHASADVPAKPGRKKPGPKPGSRKTPLATPTSATATKSLAFSTVSSPANGVREERPADEDVLASFDRLEAWNFEFTPIRRNVVTHDSVLDTLAAATLTPEGRTKLRVEEDEEGYFIAPLASTGLTEQDANDDEESGGGILRQQSPGRKASSEARSRFHPLGLASVANECVLLEVSARSLSAAACDVYVKSISEGAASAIFTNVLFISTLPNERARPWSASRTFSRPVMHGLFAGSSIPAGAFISEYRGEISSADTYRNEPANQYAVLGATKPYVHLLPPPLNLAIDARKFGTEARFARYGCHPNAVLRPILFHQTNTTDELERNASSGDSRAASPDFPSLGVGMPFSKSQEAGPEVRFGLFALRDVSKSHEIVLGWEWDDQHIVHFLPELVRNPALETPSRPRSVTALDMANKGDFPYSCTLFSRKMNSATTALLSTSFCSCIGSATPQGGSSTGSASSHNARKQDCAVAQMLRVGQGMGLMNVNIPGSVKNSHRKIRPPSFGPLVGVKRWWRRIWTPPTPPISVAHNSDDEEALPSKDRILQSGSVPGRITPWGKVFRIMDDDLTQALAQAEKTHSHGHAHIAVARAGANNAVRVPTPAEDDDMHSDDAISDVSSLTEPLGDLSDFDSADDSITLHHMEGASSEDEGSDHPIVLPLKKRIAGTRLKASHILADDPEREDKTNRRNARKAERAAATNKARAAKAAKRQASLAAARKSSLTRNKRRVSGEMIDREGSSELSSEHSSSEVLHTDLGSKRKRKMLEIQPSSPLTSESEETISASHPTATNHHSADLYRAATHHKAQKRRGRMMKDSEDDNTDMSSGSEPVRSRHQSRSKPPSAARSQGSIDRERGQGGDGARRPKSPVHDRSSLKPQHWRGGFADLADSDSTGSDGESVRKSAKRKKGKQKVPGVKKAKVDHLIQSQSDDDTLSKPSPIHAASSDAPREGSTTPMPMQRTGEVSTELVDVVVKTEKGGEFSSNIEDAATTSSVQPEPEKPRARLSLADWKRQQAEKRKAEAAAATSQMPLTPEVTSLTEPQLVSSGSSVLPLAPLDPVGPPLPLATSPPPPLPTKSSYGMPSSLPSASSYDSTSSYFPPLGPLQPTEQPLPSTSGELSTPVGTRPLPSPLAQPFEYKPTSHATEKLQSPLQSRADMSAPPLPTRALDGKLASPPPAPLAPTRPSVVASALQMPSTKHDLAHGGSRSPPPPPPLSGGYIPPSHRGAINRPSDSVTSPPLGPSHSKKSLSPQAFSSGSGHPGRTSWPSKVGSGGTSSHGPTTLLPASVATDGSVGSNMGGVPAHPSSHSPTVSTGAPSYPLSSAKAPISTTASPTGPAAVSVSAGASTAVRGNGPPPSPRGYQARSSNASESGVAPAAPAALRSHATATATSTSTGSGPSSLGVTAPSNAPSGPSQAVSAPFNPPKGPKALMTPAAHSNAATSGSNAISIRGGGGNAGFTPIEGPPSHRIPTHAQAQAQSRGSTVVDSGSEGRGSPPTAAGAPMRHVSIMGRGAAAAASAVSSSSLSSSSSSSLSHPVGGGGTFNGSSDSRVINDRHDGSSKVATGPAGGGPVGPASTPAPFVASSGGYRGGGGGGGGGGVRGHIHRGHAHPHVHAHAHAHAHAVFPRGGGWGTRGGGRGGSVNVSGSVGGGGGSGSGGGGSVSGNAGTGSNAGMAGVSGPGWAGRGRGRGGGGPGGGGGSMNGR